MGVDAGADTGSGGAGADAAKDAPADANVDTSLETAAPIDGGVDGGGTAVCRSATHAWNYPSITAVPNIAWDRDGNLITGNSAYVGTEFAGMPWTSGGNADMLVSKLNPSTGKAVWLFTAGDSQAQLVNGVAISSAGLGVIGSFKGTLDIDPVNQEIEPIVNNGSNTVEYIVGLEDADGTGMWSKKVDLKGGQLAAIAGNPTKDYVLVCGAAMNTAANLGATNLNPTGTPGGGQDVILAAVNVADGTVRWAKVFGGDMDQTCTSAALDDTGNAVFAGTYTGTLDFGTGVLSPAPADASARILWLAKLDGATGTVAAAKGFGTTGFIVPYALTFDVQGNVIAAGSLDTQVTFGTQTLVPLSPPGNGSNALVVKLDSSLTPVWARRWGSTQASCRGVAVDSAGTITVGGSFRQSADVGPGSGVMQANSAVSLESFVVTLDGTNGQTLCARNYGDASSNGGGVSCVAINRRANDANKDRMVMGGTFTGVIDFGGATTALAAPASGTASFLVEM